MLELADILARIEAKLKERGISGHRASLMAKRPGSIDNMRRAVASGNRHGVTAKTLSALAPVLGTTVQWLMSGEGEEHADEPAQPVATARLTFQAVEEALLTAGISPPLATEIAEGVELILGAQPPALPGMSAGDTVRAVVRWKVSQILGKPQRSE